MEWVSTILTICSLVTSFGSVCVMVYGFSKFLAKPHDTLEEKVNELQEWRRDVDSRLQVGNDRFSVQDDANRVTQAALLALIDKEIKDCASENKPVPEELTNARKDLYNYLTERK